MRGVPAHLSPVQLAPPEDIASPRSPVAAWEPAPPRPRPRRSRLIRGLAGVGRSLIAIGVLVLLFVVYQLWGTGLVTARAQDSLEDDLAARLAEAHTVGGTVPSTVDGAPTPRPGGPAVAATAPVAPPAGEAGGRIEIPAIRVDWIFVEGIGVDDLKKGPGHFPGTPFPGQARNASLAGPRTTYGAPFNRIDELDPGDEIVVTTVQGTFRYIVSQQQIVEPDQVEVLNDFGDNRLTLVACHPKYSARQRIVVSARLGSDPAPTPAAAGSSAPAPPEIPSLDADGDSDVVPVLPSVLLGVLAAGTWLAAWLIGRWWRRLPAYVIGLPLFLVALFFFESVSRHLPASF